MGDGMADTKKPGRGPTPAARLADALRRARVAAAERPEGTSEAPRGALAAQSRRNFILFGAGALATAAAGWWLLPERTKQVWQPAVHDPLDTLAARVGLTPAEREAALNRVLTFDDDVAEALASSKRRVRTYDRPDPTPLRNNYHGWTPGPGYLPGWRLNLSGLASGRVESLAIGELVSRFARHDMNTRLVCVEGWSHVAAWGGFRFADLLAAFPPAPGARWAAIRSGVSLGATGDPEPYYVSIDLGTARHPQALLATHHAGAPLTLAHGAPLRLVVPMKLGLKNIKAITDIAYTPDEPADYWNERGYSKYDGI
jgi:DMSO/TMAO reductase YedYZ molybdopterin-dependent catalytic subunit